MQMCANWAAVFIGCWDAVFLLERNHRNCFRKSCQTGWSSRNRKIKNTAAEMQMRASSAAVFIGCWDAVFLLERNHRNCFRKSRQTGWSSRNRKIKNTAAEMQMCANWAAVFIGCWDGVFLLERNHWNCFRKSRQTGWSNKNRRNKEYGSRNADTCKFGCRVLEIKRARKHQFQSEEVAWLLVTAVVFGKTCCPFTNTMPLFAFV